jgi:hypothetical protein
MTTLKFSETEQTDKPTTIQFPHENVKQIRLDWLRLHSDRTNIERISGKSYLEFSVLYVCVCMHATAVVVSLFLSSQLIYVLLTCVSYPQWSSSALGDEQNLKLRAYSYPRAPDNPSWLPDGGPLQLLRLHQVPHPRSALQWAARRLASHLFKSRNE